MQNTIRLAKELNIYDYCIFVGGRNDVEIFCQLSDIYVSSSFQEGLCVGVLEAMACGLPLVVTDIRGNKDQCIDGRNGFVYNINDRKKFIESIVILYSHAELRKRISINNLNDVKNFSLEKSLYTMSEIYSGIMNKIN